MERKHHKSVNSLKRFGVQLKAAQQSAGAQIDARCDINLARIDDKAKCIIKDTIKSKSIKREALSFYILSLTNANVSVNLIPPAHTAIPNKRMRQQENTIDLRSSATYRKPKKLDARNSTSNCHGTPKYHGNPRQNFSQSKGYHCSTS